jgi:hypothetical protein
VHGLSRKDQQDFQSSWREFFGGRHVQDGYIHDGYIVKYFLSPPGRGALPGFKGKFEWKTEDLTQEKRAVGRAILV